MCEYQTEFSFVKPPNSNDTCVKSQRSGCLELEWYNINKYADWVCDRVPNWMGYGLYYKYKQLRRSIISIYQKIRYGVSDKECWSLTETLAAYILPRLKHYRAMERSGVPNSCFLKHHPNDDDAPSVKAWNDVLDEMIWTFEYILDEEKFNPTPKTTCGNLFLISNEYDAVWKEYFAKQTVLERRKIDGLQLFGKHFDELWD